MIPIEINSQIDAGEFTSALGVVLQGDVVKESSLSTNVALDVINFKCCVTSIGMHVLEEPFDITTLIKGTLKDDLHEEMTTEAARMLHEEDV